jgi:xanthine/CO dehydrogenase XdhC/CoxF family maturation factor
MRVLLEPASPASSAQPRLLRQRRAQAARDARTALVVVHEAANLNLGTYSAAAPRPEPLIRAGRQALYETTSASVDFEVDGRRTRALVQFLAPSLHLLVCGAGPDAVPVVSAARALGWRVTVVDHRAPLTSATDALRARTCCWALAAIARSLTLHAAMRPSS